MRGPSVEWPAFANDIEPSSISNSWETQSYGHTTIRRRKSSTARPTSSATVWCFAPTAKETAADVIVLAGVHFMAEAAKLSAVNNDAHRASGCERFRPAMDDGDEQPQGLPEPVEQEREVVAGGGEVGVDGIALFAGEVVATHPVPALMWPTGSTADRRRIWRLMAAPQSRPEQFVASQLNCSRSTNEWGHARRGSLQGRQSDSLLYEGEKAFGVIDKDRVNLPFGEFALPHLRDDILVDVRIAVAPIVWRAPRATPGK